jgi:hypothetical protein
MKSNSTVAPARPAAVSCAPGLIFAIAGPMNECKREVLRLLKDAGVDAHIIAIGRRAMACAPNGSIDTVIAVHRSTGEWSIASIRTTRVGEFLRDAHRALRRRGDGPTLTIMKSGDPEQSAAFDCIVRGFDAEVDLQQSFAPRSTSEWGGWSGNELLALNRRPTDGARVVIAVVDPAFVEAAAKQLRALGADRRLLRELQDPIEGHLFVTIGHTRHRSPAVWVERRRVVDALMGLWGAPTSRLAVLRDDHVVVVALGNDSLDALLRTIVDGLIAGVKVVQ